MKRKSKTLSPRATAFPAGGAEARPYRLSRSRVSVTTGSAILIIGLLVVGIYFLITNTAASSREKKSSSSTASAQSAQAAKFCGCFSGIDMETLAKNVADMNPSFPTGMKKNKNIVNLARCLAKQLVAATESYKKANDKAMFDYDFTVALLEQPCVRVFVTKFLREKKIGEQGDEQINAIANLLKTALDILEDVEGGPHEKLWAEWGELNTGDPWMSGSFDAKFSPIITQNGFHESLVSPDKLGQFEKQEGVLMSLLGLKNSKKDSAPVDTVS